MKKAVLSLLFAGALALAAPAVTGNAAEEVITDSYVLEVADEPLVESYSTKPTQDVNADALTILPTAYTVGDYTYVFVRFDNSEDKAHSWCLFQDEGVSVSTTTSNRGPYLMTRFQMEKFEGSQEVTVGYCDIDGQWLAVKTAEVTAKEYVGGASKNYVAQEATSVWLGVTLPKEAAQAADLVIALYDGSTMVGKLVDGYSSIESGSQVSTLLDGIYSYYDGIYDGIDNYCVNGNLYFSRSLAVKTYSLKATAGGKEYDLGHICVTDAPYVESAYSNNGLASEHPVVAVNMMNINPSDLTVQFVDTEGQVVASSANGGQILPTSTTYAYYEVPALVSADELRGTRIRVLDKSGKIVCTGSNYNQYTSIADMYYNYRDKYVVALTSGIPDGTKVEASVVVDGVTYEGSAVVSGGRFNLAFGKDGKALAFPGGSYYIKCKFTVNEQDRENSEYLYINSDNDNSSYGGIDPDYIDAGSTSVAFSMYVMKEKADKATGDYAATLTYYDQAEDASLEEGPKFALTATDVTDWAVPMVELSGTWTGKALQEGEYLVNIYRGDQIIDEDWVYVLDPAKVYANIYGISYADGTRAVEIYVPYALKDKYDFSKFTLKAYDLLGNEVNPQYTLKEKNNTNIIYAYTGVQDVLNGVVFKAFYDGKTVYEYYDPTEEAEGKVTFSKGYSVSTYSNNRMTVGTNTSAAMSVEVREMGTFKVLKTFNVPAGQYYFTIEDLKGLSIDDRSVAYSLLFKADGKFASYRTDVYLGYKQQTPSTPDPTPTPTPTPTPAPAGDPEKVESFVDRMYKVTLGRGADESGMDTWKSGLLNGTFTGQDIANGFIMSEELQNKGLSNSEYVDVLYAAFFGREADAAGKKTWVDLLDAGTSRKFVMAGFVNSNEFDTLCTDYGIIRGTMDTTGEVVVKSEVRSFVLRIYDKVLQREGEAQGVQDWCVAIANGTFSAEDAAKLFFFSDEYLGKQTSDEEFVETLYETFMGRASDPDGKAFWLGQLQGTMTREQVLEGFSRSTEFAEILKSFGF